MAKNPFKIPMQSSLPSDKGLRPMPQMVGPETPATPEGKREKFRKLAALIGGMKPVTGVATPPPVIPPIGPKVPKF